MLESNKEIITNENILLENINQEISKTEELLTKSLKTRAELYSYDVIYGKYRNIVAVSTFYEYLASYRCNELIGTNGAYNLYENEIRMNLVVSQLSKVINLLEKIKENQYQLYSVLSESNRQLQKLNDGMSIIRKSLVDIHKEQEKTNYTLNNIKENSDLIAYNTAATAFYTKRNTEITAAIGFMMALS